MMNGAQPLFLCQRVMRPAGSHASCLTLKQCPAPPDSGAHEPALARFSRLAQALALSCPTAFVRYKKIHEPKRARVVCLTSYTACIEGLCTEVVRVNPRDCPHSLMWHSCCVKLPIDGAAAWVIILRVVRSMIETAGVVQTPNDECSRTPMSSNRQWTEEVVVVYRLSTPTSDGPVLRLPPP